MKTNNTHSKSHKDIFKRTFILIICLMLFAGTHVFAEEQNGISGQVKDAESKKAVEFCTIRVFNAKDSVISGATSDDKGFFYLPLQAGRYTLLFEHINYVPDTINLTIKTSHEFIGIIKLKPLEESIGEVTVKGEAKRNLLDKNEYIVTSKMKTGAANTKDVLSKVEGVTYDRYNNSIKVDNESNIIMLVNGLEKDQTYIQNLAPERLKKVQVIRDPGGRYALEGYSAVINIILRDDYKGWELYNENQFITDPDNKVQNFFPINLLSGSLNYTYNKINVYGKYDYNVFKFKLNGESTIEYDNGLRIEKGRESDSPNLYYKDKNNRLTFGLDYFINPKHTLSFESRINGDFGGSDIGKSRYHVTELFGGQEINTFASENINTNSQNKHSHTLYYKTIINKKNTLNFDFTYSSSKNDYTNKYFQNGNLLYTQNGISDNQNTKLYAEFEHDFNEKSSIKTGYGNTFKQNINTFGEEKTKFTLKELRHKLYAYYSLNINRFLGVKLGLAGEASTPEVEGKKRNYFIYQPYADIKIKPLKVLDIRLKYRSSSNYPSVNEANPDTIVINERSRRIGNPELDPDVRHRISATISILKGLASVEPYYRFSNKYITQTGTLTNTGIFEYTYNNSGKFQEPGIKASLTIPFGKNLIWQSNANFFKSSIVYKEKENKIKGRTMNSNLIYMNHKHKITTGIIYQKNLRKYLTAQGYNIGNNDYWGVMYQQAFFKERLNVMLFYMLPIEFDMNFEQGSYIKTDEYIETISQDISDLKNMLMLRITFRLNKGKAVRLNKKELEEQNENNNNKGGLFNH